MSRIDYSKWDKIDCSSSEEEEEESSAPRVTRLDTPSRVTRTADGKLVVEEPAKEAEPKTKPKKQPTAKIQNWTENGSQLTTEDHDLTLYWSQDRYSVCLRLALPAMTMAGKDIQVQLQGVLPYKDRCAAVGNDNVASIQVTHRTHEATLLLLQGEFPHPIHATEDSEENNNDDDYSYDWEIDRVTETNGQLVSYWVMTVRKATPMEGMVIWWRRPLKQFEEIDARQANPNSAGQGQAFQQAWEEAHRQFRQKTAAKNNDNKTEV